MSSPEHCLCMNPTGSWCSQLPAHRGPYSAGQEGLEPPTAGFGDRNSNQLSYCPVPACAGMHGPLANLPPDPEVYVAMAAPSNRTRPAAAPAAGGPGRPRSEPAGGPVMEG